MVRERASHEGTNDGRETEAGCRERLTKRERQRSMLSRLNWKGSRGRTSKVAHVRGPLLERRRLHERLHRRREDARRSQTGDRPAKDEHLHARRDTAKEGPCCRAKDEKRGRVSRVARGEDRGVEGLTELKDENREQEHPLGRENEQVLTVREREPTQGDEESVLQPRDLRKRVELGHDCRPKDIEMSSAVC